YDPARTWADHATELAGRVQANARYQLLTGELIPQAEQRVLPLEKAAELQNQLGLIEAERPANDDRASAEVTSSAAHTPLEIEAESRKLRETLDGLQKRRTELRLEVEGVWRRYHQE